MSSFTQNDAIEDGTLIDLSAQFPDLMVNVGMPKLKLVCTAAVYENYVELTPAAKRALNDVKGRAWDLIWMTGLQLRRRKNDDQFLVTFLCVTNRIRPCRVTVKCVPTVAVDGSPSLCVMMPEDD